MFKKQQSVVFSCVHATVHPALSVRRSVGPSVRRSVRPSVRPSLCNLFFLMPKMSCFLYENHWGSPTLTLLNVHGVLDVLNVLNMPMDASLTCWALL